MIDKIQKYKLLEITEGSVMDLENKSSSWEVVQNREQVGKRHAFRYQNFL